ncbi:MAG TPA: amino acid permease C-terminal domain-containing protein, partial [Chitinophagales bacterium]|nr:amino acid permease C-terminal domain-containing protein [Chitinophagales bacterium]
GQPRIWMSMSRDGLLPPIFSRIHPKYKTPSFSTLLTGAVVGIPAMFLNLNVVIDLTSVGTLFAFVLVCAGVLRLNLYPNPPKRKFETPYINGRLIMPVLLLLGLFLAFKFNADNVGDFLHNRVLVEAIDFQSKVTPDLNDKMLAYLKENKIDYATVYSSTTVDLSSIGGDSYAAMMRNVGIANTDLYQTGWVAFKHHFMMWVFLIAAVLVTIATVWKSMSLIPVLGLLSCTYLLSESGVTNWQRFLVWLVVGFAVYFFYGYKNSKLSQKSTA